MKFEIKVRIHPRAPHPLAVDQSAAVILRPYHSEGQVNLVCANSRSSGYSHIPFDSAQTFVPVPLACVLESMTVADIAARD